MTVHEYADAHAFFENARSFLFRDELKNNVLLSSVMTLAKSQRQPALVFLAAGRPAQGAALRSPYHRWIVAAENAAAAKALAVEIGKRELTHVSRLLLVDREHAASFENFEESASQNFMILGALRPLKHPAPGLLRLANLKDSKTLVRWSRDFATELELDESAQEAEEAILRSIENKLLYVWVDEGRLKAMTATGGFTPKGVRISQVYTEPASRGKHYASTLVHRVCFKLKQDEKTPVLLADAKNQQTKRIYEALGFKTVSELCELKPGSTSRSRGNGPTPEAASR